MSGRVAGEGTSRTRGNKGMTALKQATVVWVIGLLLTAGGCVTSARHQEVVTKLEAQLTTTTAELAVHKQTLDNARVELVEITDLIDQLDTARKVAKVDVEQAMASVEKLKAWMNNTVAAVGRLEAALCTESDSIMQQVENRLSTMSTTLNMPAAEPNPVRVAEMKSEPK